MHTEIGEEERESVCPEAWETRVLWVRLYEPLDLVCGQRLAALLKEEARVYYPVGHSNICPFVMLAAASATRYPLPAVLLFGPKAETMTRSKNTQNDRMKKEHTVTHTQRHTHRLLLCLSHRTRAAGRVAKTMAKQQIENSFMWNRHKVASGHEEEEWKAEQKRPLDRPEAREH